MNSRGSATNAMLHGDTVEEIYSYIDDNVQRHLDGAVPKPPRNEAMPMKPMKNSIPRSPISKPPRNEAVCWQPTAADRSKRARINCISTCVAFSFCIHFVLILFSVGCGLSLYQTNKKIDRKSCSFVNESGERPTFLTGWSCKCATFPGDLATEVPVITKGTPAPPTLPPENRPTELTGEKINHNFGH